MENNSSDFHEELKRSVLYGFTGALLSAVSRRAAGHQHIYYPPAVTGTLQLSRRNMKAPNATGIFDSAALTQCAPWKQRAHSKLTGYLPRPDRWSSVVTQQLRSCKIQRAWPPCNECLAELKWKSQSWSSTSQAEKYYSNKGPRHMLTSRRGEKRTLD